MFHLVKSNNLFGFIQLTNLALTQFIISNLLVLDQVNMLGLILNIDSFGEYLSFSSDLSIGNLFICRNGIEFLLHNTLILSSFGLSQLLGIF